VGTAKAGHRVNERAYGTPVTAAASGVAQVSEVQFLGSVNAAATYRVVLDGKVFDVPGLKPTDSTATASWSEVLSGLETRIEASKTGDVNDGYVVTTDTTAGQAALRISKGLNQAFTLAAAAVVTDLNAASRATTTDAGESRFEKREVRFDTAAVPLAAGQRYGLTVTSGAVSSPVQVTAAASDTIVTLIGKLVTAINGASNLPVTASYAYTAADNSDSEFPIPERHTLMLTADVINTEFAVSAVVVEADLTTLMPNAIGSSTSSTAVAGRAQVTALAFTGAPSTAVTYKVSIDGTEYAVRPGTTQGVTAAWDSVLGKLKALIDAGPQATATFSGQTLTLTGKTTNAFNAQATQVDETLLSASSVTKTGDFVLILPTRAAGDYALQATGSLSVVALATTSRWARRVAIW
jgi:hypothetical protein